MTTNLELVPTYVKVVTEADKIEQILYALPATGRAAVLTELKRRDELRVEWHDAAQLYSARAVVQDGTRGRWGVAHDLSDKVWLCFTRDEARALRSRLGYFTHSIVDLQPFVERVREMRASAIPQHSATTPRRWWHTLTSGLTRRDVNVTSSELHHHQ